MNVLLDTHIVLWWLADDEKLNSTYREVISSPDNLCYVSAVTIWEISIKAGLGKLRIPENFTGELKKEGFQPLPITWSHCHRVYHLPHHHRDPFDRLLVAQAEEEDLILLSVDEVMRKYGVKVL